MEYIKNYIPISIYHRTGFKGQKDSITVHNTGNPTSYAAGERNWLANEANTTYASFHIVVDETQSIECIPLDETAYHCANSYGNAHSIGIEICETGNQDIVIDNAATLIAKMLIEHGWGIDKVKKHQDWSGKYCPHLLIPKWDWFIRLIQSKMEVNEVENLVIYASAADEGAAKILSDNKLCGIISKENFEANPEANKAKHIFVVGGTWAPTGAILLTGPDRYQTAVRVCDYIREGK
jgi:N-acetylmuramoyl-L-alanine amidase